MGIASTWLSFVETYQGCSKERFLEEVDTPYLLVPPGATVAAETGDESDLMAVQTLMEPTPTLPNSLSAGRAFEYAIPLTKRGLNPFSLMVTVGRAPNNDVVLQTTMASKFHAYFRQIGDQWSLCDANSSNGTYLNGVRLPPERSRPLKSGDQIAFSVERVTFFMMPEEIHELLP